MGVTYAWQARHTRTSKVVMGAPVAEHGKYDLSEPVLMLGDIRDRRAAACTESLRGQ
jgi:hypothetical protein